MPGTRAGFHVPSTSRLQSVLHAAQAEGVWSEPKAVQELLAGIVAALQHTIAENEADPGRTWALRSPVYWDHFEMYLKETLLGACAGLPPDLSASVRRALEDTLRHMRTRHMDASAGQQENVQPELRQDLRQDH